MLKRNRGGVKKPFYKRWWFILLMFIIVFGAITDSGEEVNGKPTTENSENRIEEEVAKGSAEEGGVESKEITEEEPEETPVSVDLSVINKELEEYVELNKGWAMGTIDPNGEPIVGGEPNPEYAAYLYVHGFEYNGDELQVFTDAGFLELNTQEKDTLMSELQGYANTIVGQEEDWDVSKYKNRIYLTVYNGDIIYGHSKLLDNSDIKWTK